MCWLMSSLDLTTGSARRGVDRRIALKIATLRRADVDNNCRRDFHQEADTSKRRGRLFARSVKRHTAWSHKLIYPHRNPN